MNIKFLILSALCVCQCGFTTFAMENNPSAQQQTNRALAWFRQSAIALRNALCCVEPLLAERDEQPGQAHLQNVAPVQPQAQSVSDADEEEYLARFDKFLDEYNEVEEQKKARHDRYIKAEMERLKAERERAEEQAERLFEMRHRWHQEIGKFEFADHPVLGDSYFSDDGIDIICDHEKTGVWGMVEQVYSQDEFYDLRSAVKSKAAAVAFACVNHVRCGVGSPFHELPKDCIQQIGLSLKDKFECKCCKFKGNSFIASTEKDLLNHLRDVHLRKESPTLVC